MTDGGKAEGGTSAGGGVVLVERRGRIGVITVNRPEKRNALNDDVRQQLQERVDELAADPEVRVLIITGAGDKAFVAGADVGDFAKRTVLEQRATMVGRRFYDAIAECPKPVIAMINGYCLGGGCELALSCDIRIAADTAQLGQPEVNLGIIPGGGGTQRLTRLVGGGQASRLIYSGVIIPAAEALAIGLVEKVVPAAELEKTTMELAGLIAEKSPVALRAAKEAIRAAFELPLRAGLAREVDLFAVAFGSQDAKEGITAFLEKRRPAFQGR